MVLLLLLSALVVLLAFTFRTAVEGDGVGYNAYLHSIWVDHDLNFRDEYAAARRAGVPTDHRLIDVPTKTGLVANFFPVGTAVLATPFYLVALIFRPSGAPQYGLPFTAAITLPSLLAGLLALALCWRLTRSAVAVAALALCTPYLFYLLYEPSYSHMFSALLVSIFVTVWYRTRERRSIGVWLALGLLGGLMALVRFQDGLLLLITLLDVRRARWRLLLVLPGAFLVFSPQLVIDHAVFGSWLPQRPRGQALTLPVHALQVLFSSWNGLFVWHPLTVIAVAGMLMVRDRSLRVACLFGFLLETGIDGAAPDWWGGLAFGARRFLDLSPFFAIGFATFARRLDRRWAWGAITVFTVWNLMLAANLTYVIRYEHNPGYLGLIQGQFEGLRWLPNLFAKGVAARDLVLWPLLGGRPAVGTGLVMIVLEALAVAVAAWVAFRPASRMLTTAAPAAVGEIEPA